MLNPGGTAAITQLSRLHFTFFHKLYAELVIVSVCLLLTLFSSIPFLSVLPSGV